MQIVENTNVVTAMREKFLRGSPDGKEPFDAAAFGRRCCIYIIANLKNKKCYIGKTTHLLNRANRYIYQYRNGHGSRPIERAILEFGIENFRMFPFATCEGREELAQLESYYIHKYNTLDRAVGYNIEAELQPYVGIRHSAGHPHSVTTKMKKAKLVAAVDLDSRKFYISVGMKLFGDMIGKGKDDVKNAAKQGTRIHGYFIIYLNSTDMDTIEKKFLSGYHRFNQEPYLSALAYVKGFLEDENTEELDAAGFESHFLTYVMENQRTTTATPYQILPIETFFALNQTEDLR